MSKPHRPSSPALWRQFVSGLKLGVRAAYNPAYRTGLSSIVKVHAFCAIAMSALCLMGVLIGQAPTGNTIGAAIFALAAIILLRIGAVVSPTSD